MGQTCFYLIAGGRLQLGRDGPILARDKRLDRGLALANQAQRDRLHAPRRARSRQLAPQDRRQREAYEIIQCAPRAIGVDQIVVEHARIGHGGQDGGFGDFGKYDPLNGDAV